MPSKFNKQPNSRSIHFIYTVDLHVRQKYIAELKMQHLTSIQCGVSKVLKPNGPKIA